MGVRLQRQCRAGGEEVANYRLGASRLTAGVARVGWDVAPAEDATSLRAHDVGDDAFAFGAAIVGAGKEDHSDSVLARLRQSETESGARPIAEGMGNLGEDSRSVAGIAVGSGGSAVRQIAEQLHRVVDHTA